MIEEIVVTPDEVNRLYEKLEREAEASGYHLNPDVEFTKELVKGLLINERRYGYWACPCRLASGIFEIDRDILCPCDYRDPDVVEFGSCFCNLYVDQDIYEGGKKILPVPERRPIEKQNILLGVVDDVLTEPMRARVSRKMFFCKQCGYVVFREEPPYICPICQAKREMFSRGFLRRAIVPLFRVPSRGTRRGLCPKSPTRRSL